MKSDMGAEEKKRLVRDFTKLVDEILCYVWDPIGVSVENLPFTRREYTSYVSDICWKVMGGASEADLSNHLIKIETEYMGLSPGPEKCTEVSALIFKCYKVLIDDPDWAHKMISNYS